MALPHIFMCTHKLHNIKLTIAYDGGEFFGWQKTAMGPSVEKTLQEVLELVLQNSVVLQAASRTDRGVHAVGQVVNFFIPEKLQNPGQFLLSVNRLLPGSISVRNMEEMEHNYHPTLDCVGKEYHYSICYGTTQLPHHRFTSWHHPCSVLDIESMQKAANLLMGKHDYSSLCLNHKQADYADCIREVECIQILQEETDRLLIKVRGKSFFYQMVRTLVGTLVDVGKGKIALTKIEEMLKSKDRKCSGVTAPPHGLVLHQVFYS